MTIPPVLKGGFGHFDPKAREYVITRPDTPRPWYNYLMNDTFVSMISHTGGGLAYYKDPRLHRLLRYRYQNVPYDRPGRYLYLRDHDSGKYWAGTWAPVWTKGGTFRCRVGACYQVIAYEYQGIASEITYFVPADRPLEIWDLRVRNVSKRPRRLSTWSYAEFAFWGAMRDLMNIDNCPNVSRQRHDRGAIVHTSWNDIGTGLHDMHFVQNCGFHLSNVTPQGYNGDRDRFLGNYRDERDPVVVETGRSTNWCENGGYPIGSLEHRFTLKPGEEKRIIYQTGYAATDREYRGVARKYLSEEAVDAAFADLKTTWTKRFEACQVKTPDAAFNAAANSFIPYQAAMTLILSRSLSSYEWGVGRAIGFRDSSQDQLGMMHALPERSRQMILALIGAVNEDGSACHNSNPLTGQYGEAGFYDDQNWIASTVAAYVKETGDLDFPMTKMPWRTTKKPGTVLDRLIACEEFSWKHRGKNGLMQTGCADWNDSLNPGRKETESVFTSILYCASTRDLAELLERLGRAKDAAVMWKRYQTMKALVNKKTWDGDWYQRLIFTDGRVMGSRRSKKHDLPEMYLEPQPWSVIAGVADKKRAIVALDATERRLGTEHGHRLTDQPFEVFDMNIGSVGIFPPGIKENGSVFNHASAWMIHAEALLGRGDRAFEYWTRMCAVTKNRIAAKHECEPYVACQFISQPPFHTTGRGRNAWLTGTATWMALASYQGILGLRPGYDGLSVNPSIPSSWKGFSALRVFRGARYEITVRNPRCVSSGVAAMTVNGQPVRGCLIPWSNVHRGRIVKVEVTLG